MNETVKTNIERYIADVDPQYAILISGTWGTGKTFFIKQWITQYANKCAGEVQNKDERIPSPIQVSLSQRSQF
jgi:tRNA A37 threonylcarbamoyladenosine biosynthesis protein TsaE